ncbi:MAG: BON domain-containing protein [Wigglesworthia glossinidia]|nr:BON domain-containing protein [Wigglesworthia glossinidia]
MNNKKFLTIFFLIFSFILGCTNTQMLGSAIAIKLASDPRTIGAQIDNLTLKIYFSQVLFNDSILKNQPSRISIISYNDKLLIIGQVLNHFILDHIQNLIQNYDNTKKIYNEVRIAYPISFTQILKDTWTSINVRMKIICNKELKLRNLKILTENKEIFIFGDILNSEEKIIINTVSKVKNLHRIITFFNYI